MPAPHRSINPGETTRVLVPDAHMYISSYMGGLNNPRHSLQPHLVQHTDCLLLAAACLALARRGLGSSSGSGSSNHLGSSTLSSVLQQQQQQDRGSKQSTHCRVASSCETERSISHISNRLHAGSTANVPGMLVPTSLAFLQRRRGRRGAWILEVELSQHNTADTHTCHACCAVHPPFPHTYAHIHPPTCSAPPSRSCFCIANQLSLKRRFLAPALS